MLSLCRRSISVTHFSLAVVAWKSWLSLFSATGNNYVGLLRLSPHKCLESVVTINLLFLLAAIWCNRIKRATRFSEQTIFCFLNSTYILGLPWTSRRCQHRVLYSGFAYEWVSFLLLSADFPLYAYFQVAFARHNNCWRILPSPDTIGQY